MCVCLCVHVLVHVCMCILLLSADVLQILTNFAETDINLKSDGGTTPLMDAVKATNIYMVKQLVKKNADISITDCEGRNFSFSVLIVLRYVYTLTDVVLSEVMAYYKILHSLPSLYIPSPFLPSLTPALPPPLPTTRSYCCPLGCHGEQCGGAQAADPAGS